MKKNKPLIIVSVLLIIVLLAILFTRKNGTIKKELTAFAVKDTASINKIFMVDRKGRSVTLEKQNGVWKVNNKYNVRKDVLNTLLYTIYAMRVQSPVAKAAHNNIVKRLAASSIKTEVYQNNKLTRTFYVGEATQDQLGTFMLLEGSSEPFVMEIPGFNGYLSTRFFTNEEDWRETYLFKYGPDELKEVMVDYVGNPSNSFRIEEKNKHYVLEDNLGKQLPADETTLKRYLLGYKYIGMQNYVKNHDVDSVFKTSPFIIITAKTILGKERKVEFFHMPNFNGTLDERGKPYEFSQEGMYIRIDNVDGGVAQFFACNKLFRSRSQLQQH